MKDDHKFRDKDYLQGFKYCPVCSSTMRMKVIDGTGRMVCSNKDCDFIFYHNPVPAAGAIVIKDEKLLLVKRAHEPMKNYWCLPAGFMEWQEHPGETARREVKEETGLDIKLISLFEVYMGTDDPRTNAVLILYLAKEIGGKMAASDDAIEVDYFTFDEIPPDLAFEAHRQAVKDYLKRKNFKKL